MQKAGISGYKVIGEIPPETLKNLTFKHPFIDRQSVVVYADYVAADTGTGAVHIAPGHGEEDYETGLEYGLDVYSPVNEKGAFIESVEFFKGINVFDSNPHVIGNSRNWVIFTSGEIGHSTHTAGAQKPVIFRQRTMVHLPGV
jgi:isoleucyl-tRNA synthetase